MLDHIGIDVLDYEKSKAFYKDTLAPLGNDLVLEVQGWAGFGVGGKPDFWLQGEKKTTPGIHIAFRSETRSSVDAFYKAALKAGGKDNGAPGIREIYHPNYYGAFIFDLDGHNIEAVCHNPK
jgi:catechol 2,3-dioxygenase-like lactoylglutathione lyase family enzyme